MKINTNGTLEELRESIKAERNAFEALVNAYKDNNFFNGYGMSGDPKKAVEDLVQSIGYEAARIIVAEEIRLVGDWDGRIDESVRSWAASVDGIEAKATLNKYGFFRHDGDIHSSHLNSLAKAMRDYIPTEPETEAVEETEEASSEPEALTEEKAKALLFSRLNIKKATAEQKDATWAYHDGGKFRIGAVVQFAAEYSDPEERHLRFIVLERRMNPATNTETRYLIGALNSNLYFGSVEEVNDDMVVLVSDRTQPEQTEASSAPSAASAVSPLCVEFPFSTVRFILGDIEGQLREARSQWERGVLSYAERLLDQIVDGYSLEHISEAISAGSLEPLALNGAKGWREFAYGGNMDIYDTSIAHTLCTPSELRRCDDGRKRPNARETWLDVEARALAQSAMRIQEAFNRVCR